MSESRNFTQFSFWPERPIPTISPWPLIAERITKRHSHPDNQSAQVGLACVEQSKFFYKSAINTENEASKSLLLYYFALNLVKAYILSREEWLINHKHGLVERNNTEQGKPYKIEEQQIEIHHDTKSNIFLKFSDALNHKIDTNREIKIKDLLLQIVIGHRLIVKSQKDELFIKSKSIRLIDSSTIEISIPRGSQVYLGNDNLKEGPSIVEKTDICKKYIWPVVTTESPFRSYYLLTKNIQPLYHPLVSMYALMFHLGSVARYRPHLFKDIFRSTYSAQIVEFLNCIPGQFLYLLASEIIERDIERPSLL